MSALVKFSSHGYVESVEWPKQLPGWWRRKWNFLRTCFGDWKSVDEGYRVTREWPTGYQDVQEWSVEWNMRTGASVLLFQRNALYNHGSRVRQPYYWG